METMENDIEVCSTDEGFDQSGEMNFDLMTRYYQILLSQIENGNGEFSVIKCQDLTSYSDFEYFKIKPRFLTEN